jgi:hypothetical protein
VLHRKNSYKFFVHILDLRCLENMPQVISKLSLVEHFLIWVTKNPSKIQPLSVVLFWQISANICICRFIAFFFSSFDHGTFREVATVVYTLYVVVLGWNLKQKEVDNMLCYTNVANRFEFSFVWRKFSSVGIGEWWDELKNGQKLGDAHASPQEISKKYKHQSLEMPPRHPFFISKKSGHLSRHYILIASCTMCFSWSVSYFSFLS